MKTTTLLSRFIPRHPAGRLAAALLGLTLGLSTGLAQDEPLPTQAPPSAPVAPPNPASPPADAAAPAFPQPGRRGEGERGNRGNREDRMKMFQSRMNEFLKASLKATDEEWAVIEPLLTKVQNKQRDAMVNRFSFLGRGMGGGGFGGGRGGAPNNSPDVEALQSALANEGTAPAELKTRLEAVRETRKRVEAELEAARKELREVLTLRQEAVLVMAGILE